MKFKIPKRCPFCARKLDANGKCVNRACIAYVPPQEAEDTTEADTNDVKGKGVSE